MSELYNIDSKVYERAIKYVVKTPGAVQGQSGDAKTFTLICTLANGFLLDDEAVLAVIEAWNQTCKPPWKGKELKRKIHEARKKKPPKGKQYGWMLGGSKSKQPKPDEESQPSSGKQGSQTQPSHQNWQRRRILRKASRKRHTFCLIRRLVKNRCNGGPTPRLRLRYSASSTFADKRHITSRSR